jgi:sarcosine oxidase subunit alpha
MGFRALEIEGRFTSPPELTLEVDGQSYTARRGEPLAVTLLAHGLRVLGRSPKYHRGRGLLCGRGTCGACLARVDGEPSLRLCRCHAGEHERVETQNSLGGPRHDLLAAIDRFFPGGLDHNHLMTRPTLVNRITIDFAHRLAGLGRLPAPGLDGAGAAPDVRRAGAAVVGAGPAGRAAAEALRAGGVDTLVVDALAADGDGVLGHALALGQYDDRELAVVHHDRLVRIAAPVVVLAPGGHEQAPPCPNNDLPGVMLRRAAELCLDFGVLPGRRVVVAVAPEADESTRVAAVGVVERLRAAGADLAAVVGPIETACEPRPRQAQQLARVEGAPMLRGVHVGPGDTFVDCDALIWCSRPAPAYELPRQMGVDVPYDPLLRAFVPAVDAHGATARPGLFVAGEAAGIEAVGAARHGHKVGEAAAAFAAQRRRGQEVAP